MLDGRDERALTSMLIAEISDYAILRLDPDGRILTWNAGGQLIKGYAAEEIIGRHFSVFYPEEDVRAGKPDAELVTAATVGRLEDEGWRVRADGTQFWANVVITAIRDDTGALLGFGKVTRDLTERRNAELALIESEGRWRALLDYLPDTAVLVIDPDLRYRVAKGPGVTKQRLQDLEGRTVFETTSAANASHLAPLYRQALDGVGATTEVISSQTGRTTEVQIVPLPAQRGRAEALVVARDVTTAREREKRIVEAEESLRLLFAAAPNGIAVLESDGRIVQANPAFLTILGRPETAILGRRLGSLDHPTGRGFLRRALGGLTAAPADRFSGEGVVAHGDGSPVEVAIDLVALPAHAGRDRTLLNLVDNSERRRYEDRLAHLADHDPLTGLANRRRLDQALTHHLARCARYGPRGALLMLDLDHFKQINDTLGHSAGDQLIRSTAELLRERLRATDLVARLGGDEFAVLLPEADADAARRVAADVVTLIRQHPTVLDGGQVRQITTSIGVVLIDRADLTPSELLATADLTMYDAKDAGRDRYVLLDTATHERTRTGSRMDWAERIRVALEEDSFVLHAQPIMDLATGAVGGAELLLRMVGENGQLIMPKHFLAIAERLDLATKVDTWVCEHAVRVLEDLHRIDPAFQLEVNLSGHSVGDADLLVRLTAAIEHASIDPTRLIFEITETAAVASIETARTFAEQVKQLGCRFALDDFGAGFGSFYYLKHLPFDVIKIDGEFVSSCAANRVDRVILASIVGIAKELGQTTIAEFVTDETIFSVVREHGVDQAQGYFIGRPAPITELTAQITARVAARP